MLHEPAARSWKASTANMNVRQGAIVVVVSMALPTGLSLIGSATHPHCSAVS
jgi:hypothetical protein